MVKIGLRLLHAIAAMTVGKGGQVEAVTGAQGCGYAVVVVGVGVKEFVLTRQMTAVDGINVLADVGGVP